MSTWRFLTLKNWTILVKILKNLSDILELKNRFLNLWPRHAVPQPKVKRLVLRFVRLCRKMTMEKKIHALQKSS
jgi:hypothetical protein